MSLHSPITSTLGARDLGSLAPFVWVSSIGFLGSSWVGPVFLLYFNFFYFLVETLAQCHLVEIEYVMRKGRDSRLKEES